jgi:putative ABC transport system permease protein
LRGALLVGVLTVSVGLALIMITVNGAFATRLDDIQSQVGTSVTVRPAGSFGGGFFERGGDNNGGGANGANTNGGNTNGGNNSGTNTDPAGSTQPPATLADQDVNKVTAISHVVSVSSQMTARYSGTGLESAVQPRQGANPAAPAPPAGAGGGFRRAILVTGTDDPASLAALGVQSAQLISGRTFDASESNADVAVLGQALADHNGLKVGDTVPINGTTFQVIGIFTSGTQFGDNSLFVPLTTAQTVFDRPGEIDQAVVKADTASNVDQVAADIRQALGQGNVDVVTEQTIFQAITAPLSDAKDSSRLGMIAALGASAVVILFSIGLVARQRVKEIGILKAIGASNWHVTAQLGVETAVISVTAAILGAVATFPLAQKVANGLLSSPSTPTGGRRGQAFGAVAGRAGGVLGSVNVAVSPEIFLYALAIAIGLALIATVVPAWYVGRVRPAEVLRYE